MGSIASEADHLRVFERLLDEVREEGRYRQFTELTRHRGRSPLVQVDGREVVDWCSNDYLGMSMHPAVIEATVEAVAKHGVGSGGTRNIGGSHDLIGELEHELADLHGKERALVFTSGFVANDASLRALGTLLPGCVILSDERNHASMIDGIRHSTAERLIFRHSDPEHLRELLAGLDPERPKIVAFESIYSMDGDVAPLAELCAVARELGALTYLDETHAAGLCGGQGGGVAQHLGVEPLVTVIQGSLAKGYGVIGGFIAGPAALVDCVRSFGSGFIFTTSIPPAIAAGALASVRHLRTSTSERELHQRRIASLRGALAAAEIPVMANDSHVVPVMVGDAERCRAVAQTLLMDHAIYVQPINYPSVPRGTERLRIAPTPLHTDAMIGELVAALASLRSHLSLARE